MSRSLAVKHSEWLSLVEISGPFLTLPVLKRALPMGPDPTPLPLVDDLRVAWTEFGDDHTLAPRWIRWVLGQLLELPDEVLKEGTDIGPALTYTVPEHGVRLRPDFIVVDPDPAEGTAPARLLVTVLPPGTTLDQRLDGSTWSADAVERMAELCRGTKVRVGLVTNGDEWAIVDAPIGGATGVATWDASLWLEERLTLDAFTTLLGVRRFFSVDTADTLEAMLAESANAEAEVTDQLGKQVRAAVELLVDAMSRANRDQNGRIFADLSGVEVYEAAVTVMMRLVFLLSAEERGLFLLGDDTYDSTYAVSTLRAQLEEEADTYGEEVIARRTDAWHRLLATFRMVYAGAEHENLRLPAYGGSLFDPDRFPFLEGRSDQASWLSAPSQPLPIDNRTVLHILGALQILRFRDRGGVTEARRLSFRALDVEQIGHVYEGLLDHSAVHVDEPAVGLGGKLEPEIALELIEDAAEHGDDHLVSFLHDETGLSEKAVAKALAIEPDAHQLELLTSACDNDAELADRIAPYLGLLREDLAGLPMVFLPNSMYVTQSSDRRSSGTYYTPRVLAEEMVLHTLEPLVYSPGPAEGAEPADWKLKPSRELLELKICDMAMGSGAFLVATCRYLSARLLEAWEVEGLGAGDRIALPGDGSTVMPVEETDREILGKRLVADSCLYGVDRNPMAVEMAKLSMWLVTLAKDQPFTFVDHALRCGDSLLGITDLRQLEAFHLDPIEGKSLHGGSLFDPSTRIRPLVESALRIRNQLESFPVLDLADVTRKRQLLAESSAIISELITCADVLVSAALSTSTSTSDAFEIRLLSVSPEITSSLDRNYDCVTRTNAITDLRLKSEYWLAADQPSKGPERNCFHWPLEFPEVFLSARGDFDAIVGNPPFLGGQRISGALGTSLREYLVKWVGAGERGSADLVAYFLLRATKLAGSIGLITTNTIAQGDTREVGLDQVLCSDWRIHRAVKSRPWPGKESLEISQIWLNGQATWSGTIQLDGTTVAQITASLEAARSTLGQPFALTQNLHVSAVGSDVNGLGFILDEREAQEVINREPRSADVLKPFLGGEDVNESPTQQSGRWIINFRDMPLRQAEQYAECMRIVRERVLPERSSKSDRRLREYWWQLKRPTVDLYNRAALLQRVIVLPRVSNTLAPVFVSADAVFSIQLVVFLLDSYGPFGVLASSIHRAWTEDRASTMGAGIRYTPSDCFETFPLPESYGRIEPAAESLDAERSRLMISRGEGLTRLYRRVNDPREMSDDLVGLRKAHCELDRSVLAAYGWSEIDLNHGFYTTRQGNRFTIDPVARLAILERLLSLNHELYSRQGVDDVG